MHADGVAMLQGLGSTPVATLSVAGVYRTGKSFFLNQLIKGSGFTVGSSTESCTRGIWMWLAPRAAWSCPTNPDARLLLFDTEGLASTDQDETWDTKIFSLGILLSSFFVYNSMGVIDEAGLDEGILPLCIPVLFCIENPYKSNK